MEYEFKTFEYLNNLKVIEILLDHLIAFNVIEIGHEDYREEKLVFFTKISFEDYSGKNRDSLIEEIKKYTRVKINGAIRWKNQ